MGGADTKMRSSSVLLLSVVLCCVSWRISAMVEEEMSVPVRKAPMSGGIREVEGAENSVEFEQLGRFAVEEHNKKENALLEFAGVVKVKQQVVSGMLYYLTLEVIDGGKKKLYEAEIWEQLWLNFKELQEFKPVDESTSSITPADLGTKLDD